jgi:hypothetical protein
MMQKPPPDLNKIKLRKKSKAVANMCRFPEIYKKWGDRLIIGWLRGSGYFLHRKDITINDLWVYLKKSPELVNSWLVYSDSKRAIRGWYFEKNEEGDSFILGYFDGKRVTKEFRYYNSIEACAKFIPKVFHRFDRFGTDFTQY